MFAMRWSVVWLIFRREVRDQLRDRRTLFMILVLPILLYPMLGIGMLKLAELMKQKPRTVILVGSENLPDSPPLLNPAGDGFAPELFDVPSEIGLFRVRREPAASPWVDRDYRQEHLNRGDAELVVLLPTDLRERIADESQPFRPVLQYDSAAEPSRNAARAVREILARWDEAIVAERLRRDAKPASYTQALQADLIDIARAQGAGGSVWAMLFPFLLVMMSLTGAFYPAVDLCAGEKERGTMETLLISPATRPEIVVGKFLTVMLASVATATLNLLSMGLTALQLSGSVAGAGNTGNASVMTAPTLESAFWMVVLLVPLSAFFSALCVAMAAMARSMKEGQYYLTPLYMVALPLIFVVLVPGIDLDLFTSLVPVTGASLLLKTLMLGKYEEARRYFLPVLVPLLVYGAIALRWAVSQFQRESVLFREAERFNLKAWLAHRLREPRAVPTSGAALLCFVLMLTMAWFSMRWMGSSWFNLIIGQVAYVLFPPVLLAFLLTSSPRRTLRLYWPSTYDLALAIILAFSLNPITNELGRLVELMFPMSEAQKGLLEQLQNSLPGFGMTLLVLAVVPAICEEVAFRGFILSGLESDYRRVSAVVLSAFLFGFLHVLLSFFQQLFGATLLGLVLALLAIRGRSLLPGIVFHAFNNGLAVTIGGLAADDRARGPMAVLFRDPAHGLYHGPWIALGGIVSAVLIAAICRELFQPARGPGPTTSDLGAHQPDIDEALHERSDAITGGTLHPAGRGGPDP